MPIGEPDWRQQAQPEVYAVYDRQTHTYLWKQFAGTKEWEQVRFYQASRDARWERVKGVWDEMDSAEQHQCFSKLKRLWVAQQQAAQ